MTLLAYGSLENIYASLDTYLQANLIFADGTPITIRLHGVRRFVPPTDAAWVEAHYDFLGLHSEFLRQVGGEIASSRHAGYDESVYGTERRGYLQLNAYQRARTFATRYTTAAVRDRIVSAFAEGDTVPVYDYSAGSETEVPQVGAIILDGIASEHVVDTALYSGVTQHVVQIATRYLERYTR